MWVAENLLKVLIFHGAARMKRYKSGLLNFIDLTTIVYLGFLAFNVLFCFNK